MYIRRLVLVLVVLIGLTLPALGDEYKINVGGHTFTANLPSGWTVGDTPNRIIPFNPARFTDDTFDETNGETIKPSVEATYFTGTMAIGAFMYDIYNEESDNTGGVTINVIRPTQEHLDASGLKANDPKILIDAAAIYSDEMQNSANAQNADPTEPHVDYSEKDITFNGGTAHIVEDGGKDQPHMGVIAFFLNDGSIAVIEADTGSSMGSTPWDIINGISVA